MWSPTVRGMGSVVVVADRGMLTKANIQTLKDTEGVGWITALSPTGALTGVQPGGVDRGFAGDELRQQTVG